jgi:hypothetical protein
MHSPCLRRQRIFPSLPDLEKVVCFLVRRPHANNLVARFSDGNQRAQPVVEWSPASSGVELGATWIGLIICGTKRPNIGNLPKRLKIHKTRAFDLAAVCEEAADNIEDRMPGG